MEGKMEENTVVVNGEESIEIPQVVSHSRRIQPFSSSPSFKERKEPTPTISKPTWSEKLGLHEFVSMGTWRTAFAEFLGIAVGTFTMDSMVLSTLQTNTWAPNLVISVIATIVVTVVIASVCTISGGHLNPAISLCLTLMGYVTASRAIIFVIAQSVGAIVGSLALKAVISTQIQNTYALGGCSLSVIVPGPDGLPTTVGIGTGQALWLEIFSFFVIMYVAAGIGFNRSPALARGPIFGSLIIGILVGLMVYVTTQVTMVQGYTGAGLNPVRCFGPAVVRGGHLWDRHWVFWVGPAIATVVFYLYTLIVPNHHFYKQD